MQDLLNKIVKDNRNLYYTSCNNCNIFIGYQRLGRSKTGLCRSCFGKTLKNKVVSEETKQKMKANHFSKKETAHPRLGKRHSAETIARISQAASMQNATYKPDFLYNNMMMRSSWEVRYAKWLDTNGIGWKYEYPFKLKSGKIYLADFVLESGEVVEIKGYFREDAKIKWDQFCEEYSSLKKSLLGKKELKALGII